MTATLVLAVDEDDALAFVLRRKPTGHVTLVWHGCMRKLIECGPFDGLMVTAAVHNDPRAEAWIAACRTRVRGTDGRTPAEQIAQ